jgi:putative tricarboxylic transport membrane protein
MSDEYVDDFPAVDKTGKATGKKKADAITAIVLLAFSAYVIVESLRMKLHSEYGPGPGLFPLGLGVILAVLSLALLWDGINPRKEDKAGRFQNKKGILSAGLVILGLIGYALLINWLGYLTTTFVLVLFLMGVVARDHWKTTILTASGVTLLLYLIFQVGLDVQLPKGPFGF